MRLGALIEDRQAARRILDPLGFSSRAPPRGRSAWPGLASVHDRPFVDTPDDADLADPPSQFG